MPDVRPKIHPSTETLSHTISTQVRIRSASFLKYVECNYGLCYLSLVRCHQKFSNILKSTQQPQVSRTFLMIFALPRTAAFCISSMLLFKLCFSNQFSKLLEIVPRDPMTIGITLTCQIFFTSLHSSL